MAITPARRAPIDGQEPETLDAGGPSSDPVDVAVADMMAIRRDLDRRVAATATLLAGRGEWSAVVRLLVLVGGWQEAEVARVTGVMRSTAGRWFNGETEPQPGMIPVYLADVLGRLGVGREVDLHAKAEILGAG